MHTLAHLVQKKSTVAVTEARESFIFLGPSRQPAEPLGLTFWSGCGKKKEGEEEEKKGTIRWTLESRQTPLYLLCLGRYSSDAFWSKRPPSLPTEKENTKINPNTQQHQQWRRRAEPRLDHCLLLFESIDLRVWQNSQRCHFKKNMKKIKKRWRRGESSCLNNGSEGNEPQPPAFVGDYGELSPGLAGRRSAVGWRRLMKDKLNFL